MKLLSPKVHGVLDYLAGAALLLAPVLFGITGIAATLLYVFGVVHLAMSIMTDYPLGIAKLIPFPFHGGVELATAIFFIAAPWLFGFADQNVAQALFLAFGGTLGLVWLTTNYKAAEHRAAPARSVRWEADQGLPSR